MTDMLKFSSIKRLHLTHFVVDVSRSEEVFYSFGRSVDLDTPVKARKDVECKEEEEEKPHELEEVFGDTEQRELVLQITAARRAVQCLLECILQEPKL